MVCNVFYNKLIKGDYFLVEHSGDDADTLQISNTSLDSLITQKENVIGIGHDSDLGRRRPSQCIVLFPCRPRTKLLVYTISP
jgi:hypothetical protein